MTRRWTAGRSMTALTAGLLLLAGLAAPSGAYQRPGTTERVSVSSAGKQGKDGTGPDTIDSPSQSISGDGRFVAFTSILDDLVSGDTNGTDDVFVRDGLTGKTERISQAPDGTDGIGPCLGDGAAPNLRFGSDHPSISLTGRYVAFQSCASNLVPGDINQKKDVFLYDRKKQSMELISIYDDGHQGLFNVPNEYPSLSRDGRYVAFSSPTLELNPPVPPETIAFYSRNVAFVRDRWSGTTEAVSISADGTLVDGSCAIVSANGYYVAYTSGYNDPATQFAPNVYLRRLDGKGDVEVISRRSDGTAAHPLRSIWNASSCAVGGRGMSNDGRFVLFGGHAEEMVPNDGNSFTSDLYVRDRNTDRLERVSVTSEGIAAPSSGYGSPYGFTSISPDGRFVAFISRFDMAERQGCDVRTAQGTPNEGGVPEPFLHDRKTGVTERIAVPHSGAGCTGGWDVAVSSRGRFLAWSGQGWTDSDKAVAKESTHSYGDTYVRDRGADVRTKILRSAHAGARGPARGGGISAAAVVTRPLRDDVFVRIEVDHMPKMIPSPSPILYGLRFEVADKSYEVRATSLLGGTFGLFDCTNSPTCTKVADLKGGYGTTGMRVVFSIPLEKIGLEDGGKLKDVEAFSGLGSYLTGATKILDTVRLK